MNRNDWNTPAASLKLALLHGAGTALFVVYGYLAGDLSLSGLQLAGLVLLVYGLLISALQWIPFKSTQLQHQALSMAFVMMALPVTVAALSDIQYVTGMLVPPALHAVTRQRQRAALATVLLCGALWLVLNNSGQLVEWQSWIRSGLQLLPVALLLWVLRELNGEVADSRNRITALSYRDELTGLLNMRAFTRMLQGEHRAAAAGAGQYALLMIDIDHLQVFNDRYGHEQGNRVIVAVADAIKRSTRSDDLIARYGGDEYVVYLPGAGDEVAETVTNRIAQNVYNITLSFDRSMQRVSVNTGRAIYPDSGSSIQDMMSFADRAMYRDKEFRRNVGERKTDVAQLKAQAGVEDWG